MLTSRNLFAVAATLVLIGMISGAWTLSATAATAACGPNCISIFSKALGTYKQLGPVEDVLDGAAVAGQPVVLRPFSASDTSGDFMPTGGRIVSDFYKSGLVSADVNSHYGALKAAQIEYAPGGKPSGLCVGLAKAPYENEGLTLQPCTVQGLTVWIIDTADSPATAAANYFPIVNASTTDFSTPFAMNLPPTVADNQKPPQIQVSRLQFAASDKTLLDRQLWGAHFGPLQ